MASELAVTRNAALAKCVRMGWTRPTSAASILENRHKLNRAQKRSHKKKDRPDLKQSRQTNYGGRANKILRDAAITSGFEDIITEYDREIPLAQRKTVLELTPFTCRFPIGNPQAQDFYFCGVPSPFYGYCEHHHKRVWVKPRRT